MLKSPIELNLRDYCCDLHNMCRKTFAETPFRVFLHNIDSNEMNVTVNDANQSSALSIAQTICTGWLHYVKLTYANHYQQFIHLGHTTHSSDNKYNSLHRPVSISHDILFRSVVYLLP